MARQLAIMHVTRLFLVETMITMRSVEFAYRDGIGHFCPICLSKEPNHGLDCRFEKSIKALDEILEGETK